MRLLIVIIMLFCLSGCGITENEEDRTDKSPTILEDIAYDMDASHGYRVYIMENNAYTPYLVLTSNYNGNCLLLREFLLDDARIYNEIGEKAAYYEYSSIDCYLNDTFINTLSTDIRNLIVKSTIEITDKESIGVGGEKTTTIERYVFLLSFAELNSGFSRTNIKEGNALLYFEDNDRRIATYQDNTPGSWWLRTPNTSGRSIVCGVSKEGIVGIGGIYDPNVQDGYYNGVRPAFCLPNDTQIERVVIDGVSILVINTS